MRTLNRLQSLVERLLVRLFMYRWVSAAGSLALLGLLGVVPAFVRNEYYIRVINLILIYSMLALGLNVVLGYTGVFHFGQAAMYAIGAYTTALLTTRYQVCFPLAFIASALIPVFASFLLSFPSLRVRGDYLSLVTFAFGEIVYIVANSWVRVTRGPMGIPGIPPPKFFDFTIQGNVAFYYYALMLMLLIYLSSHLIVNSHFGRAFLAIREDETAASAIGIDTGRYKMLAFAISALAAGVAGSCLASYFSFVGPSNFTTDISILAVEAVILGGMASLPGSIVGSAIVVIALEVLRSIAQFRKALMGATIILILIFRPQGLLGGFNLRALLARRSLDPTLRKPCEISGRHAKSQTTADSHCPKVVLRGIKVTKNFGGVQALKSLDFELYEGEILGLIGPNGSGKTTLFNVISGILPPTSGEVFFDGKPIHNLPAHVVAMGGLHRTFQNVRLFRRLSVLTNVKIGAHADIKASLFSTLTRSSEFRHLELEAEERARYWLDFVGLHHRANELACTLPYGEQKLLEIARALASNPKVLLLDEPAAGLNPNEVVTLANVIRRIREMGITVFVVEHNMRLIMDICDRIMVIHFGEKVTEGTPAQIRGDPAVQRVYLGT